MESHFIFSCLFCNRQKVISSRDLARHHIEIKKIQSNPTILSKEGLSYEVLLEKLATLDFKLDKDLSFDCVSYLISNSLDCSANQKIQ